ncbi:hypothetical protein GJ496_006282 [Pomphorhynchus laevis]|nr:hypothetical protein GJ496_006282 [Pomphorhynchus laevis]
MHSTRNRNMENTPSVLCESELKTPAPLANRDQHHRTAFANLSNRRIFGDRRTSKIRTSIKSHYSTSNRLTNNTNERSRQMRKHKNLKQPRRSHVLDKQKSDENKLTSAESVLKLDNQENQILDKNKKYEKKSLEDTIIDIGLELNEFIKDGVKIIYSIGDPISPVLGNADYFQESLCTLSSDSAHHSHHESFVDEPEDDFEDIAPYAARLSTLCKNKKFKPSLRTVPENSSIYDEPISQIKLETRMDLSECEWPTPDLRLLDIVIKDPVLLDNDE